MFGRIFRGIGNSNLQTKKPVVFIHIPKTGGKSFERLLRRNYPDESSVIRIYRTGGQDLGDVFSKIHKKKIRNAELVYGHIPHRIESYMGRECDYFTVLRNPVDRILSFYRYVKYDFESHKLHSKFKSGELTLEEYIESSNLERNKMTKMLAGIDSREPPCEGMLDMAITNLENMKVFGLLEMFDESCLLISKRLGWREPFYETTNVTSDAGKREVLDDRVRDLISEANNLDIQLYAHAKRLFLSMIDHEGDPFMRVLQCYKELLRDRVDASIDHPCRSVVDSYLTGKN